MIHLHGDTFEILREPLFPKLSSMKADQVSLNDDIYYMLEYPGFKTDKFET